MILGICSMLVPMPWATKPPQRFSRKLSTANPTMFAQHPTVAAPAAKPFKFNIIDYDAITESGTSTITEKYLNTYAYKDNSGNYYMLDEEDNLVEKNTEIDSSQG